MTFPLPSTGQACLLACSLRRSLEDVGDSLVEFFTRLGKGDGEAVEIPRHAKSPEDRRQLIATLRCVPCLRDLDDHELACVADAMHERQVQPNETVVNAGEDGDNFLVIRTGCFQVVSDVPQPDGSVRQVHQFRDSGCFGDSALLRNRPRLSTVKAISPGTLWVLDRRLFRATVLPTVHRQRGQFSDILMTAPGLEGLSAGRLGRLVEALRLRTFGHFQIIQKAGQTPDGIYFVIDGGWAVPLDPGGRRTETRIGPGGHVGVASLKSLTQKSTPAKKKQSLSAVTAKASVVAMAAAGPGGLVRTALLPIQEAADGGESLLRLLGPCWDRLLVTGGDEV